MTTITTWIMILTSLLWIAWDIYVYANGGETISIIVTDFAYYSPMLPFICGLLCGHWFWPMDKKK